MRKQWLSDEKFFRKFGYQKTRLKKRESLRRIVNHAGDSRRWRVSILDTLFGFTKRK